MRRQSRNQQELLRSQRLNVPELKARDVLPTTFYEFLTNPPSDDKNGITVKKRKTTLETPEPGSCITASRFTLEIDFPKSHLAGSVAVERRQLPVRFETIDDASAGPIFELVDYSQRPQQSLLRVGVDQIEGYDEDARIATAVSREERSSANPIGPGRLWLDTRFRLYRRATRDGRSVDCVRIEIAIKWNTTTSVDMIQRKPSRRPALDLVVSHYFPDARRIRDAAHTVLAPLEFYQSLHVPPQDGPAASEAANIATDVMEATLFPFQKRAVQWLLHRESARWSQDEGRVVPQDVPAKNHFGFVRGIDADGQECFVSNLLMIATLDDCPFDTPIRALRGGVLAEEMGLGKTVEMITLMTLHRRQLSIAADDLPAKPTAATLIITPPSILPQWISELNSHSPSLKVFNYKGVKGWDACDEFVEHFMSHDVVVTTYNVLSAEIHFATPPPDRQLRHERKYARPESPLIKLEWWRVCLDEAQMIESGVSNAAKVARLIPRVNAWGITGTPLKRNLDDLLGLLTFLQYEPYTSATHLWKRLIREYKQLFRATFGEITLRHTKQLVRDELTLPPQRRFVITVPFTPVEEQYYKEMHTNMAADCGLDTDGSPLSGDWELNPDILEKMRTWLVDLRMCALHPGASMYGRRIGRKDGPLRTVDEVLQAMLDAAEHDVRRHQRSLFLTRLQRGQMLENSPRVREALEIWTGVLLDSTEMVDECRRALQVEIDAMNAQSKAKAESGDESDGSDDEESVDNSRLGALKMRLRSALEIQHGAIFYQSNAYFQIKSNEEWTTPDSDEFKEFERLEVDGYESAKRVRREILTEITHKVDRHMKRLAKKAAAQSFAEIPDFPSSPPKGGIESQRNLARLDALAQALDVQANQLDEWRETTIQLLLRRLVDEDEGIETTGDEYEESTKTQDEVLVYVQALRAMIADRHDALTGQVNERIKQEVATTLRFASDGVGAFPEKTIQLLKKRELLKPTEDMGSVRGVLSELRALSTTLRLDSENGSSRATAELAIVDAERDRVQKQVTQQLKTVQALEKELDAFTTLMNLRLEYYRQLQEVSDTVLPYEGPKTDRAYEGAIKKENGFEQSLASARSKRRYLLHLRHEAADSDEQRTCVICTMAFEIGALTVCGHQFCKDCIGLWWSAHRNCPVCKRKLTKHDMHDITYRSRDIQVQVEDTQPDKRELSSATSIYTGISSTTLAEIKHINLDGPSFTTKVDTLVRHILWLRERDPGAKCITFSQFTDFLNVLARAFSQYRIGYASIQQSTSAIEKFKHDPSIECFLLHARAHSSGLNLVNASHVFLCEPLINTALELQAIARVDRIGQRRATTVWLYLVDRTVEEAIYNISVQRRMEHMGRRKKGKEVGDVLPDRSLEAANSMEMEEANLGKLLAQGRRGEAVDDDDLWPCLFGGINRDGARAELVDQEVRRHLAADAAERRAEQ